MGSISRIGLADRPDSPPAGGAWRRCLTLVSVWLLRVAQRRQLAEIALDPHMLRDLGLTEHDAAREIRKQFWRP
jgi:uncharacterized protein YjiS (DUF1127 family)